MRAVRTRQPSRATSPTGSTTRPTPSRCRSRRARIRAVDRARDGGRAQRRRGADLDQGRGRRSARGSSRPRAGPTDSSWSSAALIGAIVWNLITWRFGLPVVVDARPHRRPGRRGRRRRRTTVNWSGLVDKVVIPMVLSPVIGLGLGYLLMVVILWMFRQRAAGGGQPRLPAWPDRLDRGDGVQPRDPGRAEDDGRHHAGAGDNGSSRRASTCRPGSSSPPRARWGSGRSAGGWRVIRTLGSRITPLDPPRAFAAQTAASSVLLVSAYAYAVPVSSTHVMTTSIMGVGATPAALGGALGRGARGRHRRGS